MIHNWEKFDHMILAFCCSASFAGCSRSPGRIELQSLDPSAAAERAVEELDSNGDGSIDEQEALQSPGLAAAFKQFDRGGDGRIDEQEIEQRLEQWGQSKVAMFATPCSVYLDGKPLSDATVVFAPEPFLGNSFKTLEGTTSPDGRVRFPTLEGMPGPGLLTGLYRVKITKSKGGNELIPDKYNENTTLGQEVFVSAPGIGSGIVFRLSSKD